MFINIEVNRIKTTENQIEHSIWFFFCVQKKGVERQKIVWVKRFNTVNLRKAKMRMEEIINETIKKLFSKKRK